VVKFLGEGGKKRVYLAHDTLLDRDVAFALIKTEGLDEVGRERIRREAQAMGRLGAHPHVVSVFDLGETDGQPFIVTELMGGGDVEGLIEKAPEHRVPLSEALRIADEVCRGLEFAHARQIVHRDLKPGNVWLTAEGTAKIGDFGLAVATDRARLTQPGLMVGTVSYMPPEQAMGGEVTPRSDLYSLGAMLYELVTGRPPFVGDESVAIITQHLNVPPVAPSWHVPDLPPGLEAIILRLIEKDPNKRPDSASEVREALTGIASIPATTGAQSAPSDTTGLGAVVPGAGASPLYRRIFVGREAELRQLQAAFDAAFAGTGAIAMVVGEPGIGKTSLCEQLATFVAVRGGRALVGHCYEEGSLSLPYLPFVEAMRSYVLTREPDGLRQELGSGAAEVARIVSEVRDRLSPSEFPIVQSSGPEDDRWRLLQAITGFLRNASHVQPLLIVLEDLHDADRGTLDLLLHLARNLQGTRLLIVGTYRDVEVDRTHPLSSALAELRRSAGFVRVPLRGLTVDEVHRMYCLIRGQEVPWSRAEAIHRQTEGNPLFVQEVLRYLVEEGLVVRQGGQYALTPEGADAGIPEGLRDVVGKRLSRLSDRANQVLSVASVIGRDFRLDVLQHVVTLSEDEVIEALEEAQERAVIEERSAAGALAFRFTHAFFRQTLYEEIFAARRIRWHQQVARALEGVHAKRLEEHAAELVEHFAHSSDPEDLTKAVAFAELAARRAESVYAYGEAVRHWSQAVKAQEVLDPDNQLKRCDLLIALGEAMLPLDEPAKFAATVAPEAYALAEAIGDSGRAARVAVLAAEGLIRSDIVSGQYLSQTVDWCECAAHHAPRGTPERIYADAYRGNATIQLVSPAAGHVYLREAMDQALALGDNRVIFAAAGWAFFRLQAVRDQERRERLADEVLARPRGGVRSSDLGMCLSSAAQVLLARGERERAEAAWNELAELAERTRDVTLSMWAIGGPVILAFVDGRITEASELADAGMASARERGISLTWAGAACRLACHLGRGREQWLDALDRPVRPSQAHRALVLAHLGHRDEVQAIVDRFFGTMGSDADESSAGLLFALLEACLLAQLTEPVRILVPRLRLYADKLAMTGGSQFGGSGARMLGDGAVLLEQPDQARAYYQQALEVCARVRFRPEIAITRLHLAELLLQDYPAEQADAQGHLDFAIDEFRAMQMQPALERALRHKGLLHA
jgi:tetratricopeptide (TPR) repeat protein